MGVDLWAREKRVINNKIGEVPERDTHKRIGWKDQAESGRNQLSVVQKHLTRKERTGGKENERAERGREAEREKKENGSNGSITRLPQLKIQRFILPPFGRKIDNQSDKPLPPYLSAAETKQTVRRWIKLSISGRT